mmetsp:Transcript_42575/g.104694  ORF Transcript_42575/g.104694 Transcript_42575/m.104694 type:complete len:226 (+) Transcript_42575:728-1405(+)
MLFGNGPSWRSPHTNTCSPSAAALRCSDAWPPGLRPTTAPLRSRVPGRSRCFHAVHRGASPQCATLLTRPSTATTTNSDAPPPTASLALLTRATPSANTRLSLASDTRRQLAPSSGDAYTPPPSVTASKPAAYSTPSAPPPIRCSAVNSRLAMLHVAPSSSLAKTWFSGMGATTTRVPRHTMPARKSSPTNRPPLSIGVQLAPSSSLLLRPPRWPWQRANDDVAP